MHTPDPDEAASPPDTVAPTRVLRSSRGVSAATFTLILASCSTLNPQIISKDLILGRTTSNDWSCTVGSNATPDPDDKAFDSRLAEVIGQVNALRNDYLCAVKEQTALPNYIGAALIPLTAVSLYRGITASTEGTQKWLAAAGITGAAAYAYGTTYTSKPRTLVYLAGADALGCAVLATRPYLYLRDATNHPGQTGPRSTTDTADNNTYASAGVAARNANHNEDGSATGQAAAKRTSVCGAIDFGANHASLLNQHLAAVRCEIENVRSQLAPLKTEIAAMEPAIQKCNAESGGHKFDGNRGNIAAQDRAALAQDPVKRRQQDKDKCMKENAFIEARNTQTALQGQITTIRKVIKQHEKLVDRGVELDARIRLASDELREKANAIQSQVAAEVLKAQPELSNIMQATDALRANAFRFSGADALKPPDATPSGQAQSDSNIEIAKRAEPALQQSSDALASLNEAAVPLIALLEQADALSKRVGNVAQCRFDAARINGVLSITPDDDEVEMTAGGVFRWALVGNGRLPQYSFGGAVPKDTTLSLADQAGQPAVVLSVPAAAETTHLNVVFADPGGTARRTVRVTVKAGGTPKSPTTQSTTTSPDLAAINVICGAIDGSKGPECLKNKRVKEQIETCANTIKTSGGPVLDESNPELLNALAAAKGVGSKCTKP